MESMEKVSMVARDILIEKLPSAGIPLTISLEHGGNDLKFPLALPSDRIRFERGLFIVDGDFPGLESFVGKKIRAQFYMNGLGYAFNAVLKKSSRFYAFVLPDEIGYLRDEVSGGRGLLQASLTYRSKNTDVVIKVRNPENYGIFAPPKWNDVPEMYREKARTLLASFVKDSRSGFGGEIGNGLHLISVARYLCDDFFDDSGSAGGKILPLDLIFIDDSRVVLGDRNRSYNLALEDDYGMCAEFSIAPCIRRKIRFTCTVEDCYPGAKNSCCYICRISGLKEEDSRFLREGMYGKK